MLYNRHASDQTGENVNPLKLSTDVNAKKNKCMKFHILIKNSVFVWFVTLLSTEYG